VPDRPGLRFDTGNAGGLEITVDGQTVPPLGPSGAVRRNIPLDADKLAAGAHH
jgi:cytoskeleton protein RodZ